MNRLFHFLQNHISTRLERIENCFNYLNDKNIEICNYYTGNKIDKAMKLYFNKMYKYNDLNVSYKDYCLKEFWNNKIAPCNEIKDKDVLKSLPIAGTTFTDDNVYFARDNYIDKIKIPASIPTLVISIGESFTFSRTPVNGCKFIIVDFNSQDPDIIDFSNYPSLKYENLSFTKFLMSDNPAIAIHLSDQLMDYFVCFYECQENLPKNLFKFADFNLTDL